MTTLCEMPSQLAQLTPVMPDPQRVERSLRGVLEQEPGLVSTLLARLLRRHWTSKGRALLGAAGELDELHLMICLELQADQLEPADHRSGAIGGGGGDNGR